MYLYKRKEVLLPDGKSISFHSVSSESYSYYNRSGGNVVVSGEFVDVTMTRRGDSVRLKDTSLFPHAEKVAKKAREFAYEHLNKSLSEASPSMWSDYFFGHIRLWTPKGIKDLTSYIIDLNDVNKMSREDIASHISDLMGAAEPKIPMNPMSWILEDRPVEVSELEEPNKLAVGGTIDASKIKASSITVGTANITSEQLKTLKGLGVEVYVADNPETFSKKITVKKDGYYLSKEITNELIYDPGIVDKIIEFMVKAVIDKVNQTSATTKAAKIYEEAKYPAKVVKLSKDGSGEVHATYTVSDDAYEEAAKGNLMGASIVEGPVPGGHFIDYVNDMPKYHAYIPELPAASDYLKGMGDVL